MLASQVLRVRRARHLLRAVLVGLMVVGARREGRASPGRLGQMNHQPGQEEGGKSKDHKCGPPGEGGDVARDGKPEARAEQLTGEDEAIDPATLAGREIVADERGNERPGCCRDRPQEHASEEQLTEAADARAPQHRRAPQHNRAAERPRAPDPVSEHPERQRRHHRNQ